jgi:hypothetical protein
MKVPDGVHQGLFHRAVVTLQQLMVALVGQRH